MSLNPKIIQLRQLLSERFPGARFSAENVEKAHPFWPTGIAQIDGLLRGGLPKGSIVELVSSKKNSGSGLLISALLRKGAAENQIITLIDGQDSFDPCAFEQEILSRLLWVVLSSEDCVSESEKKDEWFKDMLMALTGASPLLIATLVILVIWASNPSSNFVVVYTPQDQTYAEPIFHEFTKQTGIKVRAVYDSEAVKTVGLVNRLIAEQKHSQCDVFWNNEELRTHQLANETVLWHTNSWMKVGYRARQLVINTNLVSAAQAPKSLHELTNSVWRGKVVLAYPLFGTTATHFLALRQLWGESVWENFCRALRANDALLVDGNSVVVKLVGRGEALIGLTDSDDILAGQREGLPIAAIDLGSDGLFIANTVCVIRNAPHSEQAQKLLAFLTRRETVEKLVQAGALIGVAKPERNAPVEPDWNGILQQMEPAVGRLKEIFLR